MDCINECHQVIRHESEKPCKIDVHFTLERTCKHNELIAHTARWLTRFVFGGRALKPPGNDLFLSCARCHSPSASLRCCGSSGAALTAHCSGCWAFHYSCSPSSACLLVLVGAALVFLGFSGSSNMALNLAPFGRWTLRDKAAQRRLALLQGLPQNASAVTVF